ncbi:MAG: histidinol-phosphatase HisJ family protein [Clostridiales bacterium]|nr:histidinol-phosphatase HisJ family protein [Clostridiales bacterium]
MSTLSLNCLADCHTHSKYSFDGCEEITDMCETAIKNGIKVLTVTDHCDIDDITEGRYPEYDAENAQNSILEAQETYRDRLMLMRGLELGQPIFYPEKSAAILDKYRYDFVLGSMHNLMSAPDFSQFKWADMTESEIGYFFQKSLSEIERIVDFPGINSIAHINYPVRYIRRAGKDLDYDRFLPQIERIYKKIISKNLSLECNTSGWHKQPVPEDTDMRTLPDTDLMKLYYDLGGRMVTIGSDAHKACFIGTGITETLKTLKKIGFEYITVYTEGNPNSVPINI